MTWENEILSVSDNLKAIPFSSIKNVVVDKVGEAVEMESLPSMILGAGKLL